jgi:hypothetical protein
LLLHHEYYHEGNDQPEDNDRLRQHDEYHRFTEHAFVFGDRTDRRCRGVFLS